MREPESVTVSIFGQEYTLKGDAESDYVQKLAQFVDERMNEVARNSSIASTAKVAILAAVNIADELFREQHKRLENMVTLEDRSVLLTQILTKEMGGNVLAGEVDEKAAADSSAKSSADSSVNSSGNDKNSLPGT